jgi:hypothetical protein
LVAPLFLTRTSFVELPGKPPLQHLKLTKFKQEVRGDYRYSANGNTPHKHN